MGQGKLGRYCEQAKRWLIPEVWAKWWRKRKNYPKCVPIAKARAMSKGQRAGAVRENKRKQILVRHRVELQRCTKKKESSYGWNNRYDKDEL